MQKLIWQNSNGESVDLTQAPYGITNWEGFANTSLNIQSQQVPFQDGGVFLDALIEQRELSVTLAMQDNNSLEERYRMRRELIHSLNPKLGEGYLIYTNDFISKRIKCVAQIPLFETHNSNDSGTPKASLAWTACEPYWEDTEETEDFFKVNQPIIIKNNGDIPTQFEIELYTENAVNPYVERMNDNKKIEYKGNLDKTLYISTLIGKRQVLTEELEFENINIAKNSKDICYSSRLGLAIAVADGVIYRSYGGLEWSNNISTLFNGLNGICYSEEKELFIAVGNGGKIITSSDGVNWVERDSGVTTNLNRITYSSKLNLFIIVGAEGVILSSINGNIWNPETSGTVNILKDIIYSEEKELFVAVGDIGTIVTSTDGVNWVIQTSVTNRILYAITYSSKLDVFLIVSMYGNFLTSSDGIDWTLNGIGEPYNLTDVVYSDFLETFIVTRGNGVYVSQDYTNWEWISFATNEQGCVIVSINELRKVILAGKSIYNTINGADYNIISNTVTMDIQKIIYVEKYKKFFAVGNTGIMTSTDGKMFQRIYTHSYSTFRNIMYSKEKDLFIAIGSPLLIVTSSDGVNWVERSFSLGGNTLLEIAYSNKIDKFLIAGVQGILYGSNDGINWTRQNAPSNLDFHYIYYFEKSEQFILIGNSVWESIDGETWTTTQKLPTSINSIIYSQNQGLYVAIGKEVLTSKDGEAWQTVVPLLPYTMNRLAYSEEINMFIAINYNGVILVSRDLENWNEYELNITLNLRDIIYVNSYNTFYLVGYEGSIFNTEFIRVENKIQNISEDSDMGLSLLLGENIFRVSRNSGNINARIVYRQKYIGV